ncbi:MAG: formylglycine-generating enzyme family protein [Betaproteobacteria bacterium]|nr:formylglycine-generating enzyme family protein [Betaproteobacteria bacterium]
MRIILLALIFSGLLLCGPQPMRAATDVCNPSPAEADLVLPAPGGQCLVFRAVSIGEGNNPIAAQKRFTMGDVSGGFKETPTTVALGGNFLLKQSSTDAGDWVYYIGKYEVTEGLYYSVIGLPPGKDPALLKSMYPIASISYFDALAFINKLNIWLYANAMNELPMTGKIPGFLRLPTEAEWEFAARGGNAVPSDIFGNRMPYKDDALAAYEWFSGPSSSHNKVQLVGKLKPNPLGLHDMLGNVSEMVSNTYQIEYYQGRNGGLTARGGHFFTEERQLHSSLRTEEPMYIGSSDKGMKPNAKPTMGFRLVFGSSVLIDRAAINAIEEAWEPYRTSARAVLPAGLSTAPVDQQTVAKIDDANAYLGNIKSYFSKTSPPESIVQDFGRLESVLGDTVKIRRETDEKIARSSVRTAVTTAVRIAREMQKLPVLEDVIKEARERNDADMAARLEKRLGEINDNITADMTTYYDTLNSLVTLNEEIVGKAFSLHSAYLNEPARKAVAQWPLLTIDLAKAHYEQFFKDKQGNSEAWRRDFSTLKGVVTED